jgi:hypothetical protein
VVRRSCAASRSAARYSPERASSRTARTLPEGFAERIMRAIVSLARASCDAPGREKDANFDRFARRRLEARHSGA